MTGRAEAPAQAALPFTAAADGLLVRVRVSPRAGANRVDGLAPEADGGVALKVAVTAPPEGGKANAALVKLLAREWGLAKSTIAITAGAAARRKSLHLAGDPRALARQLEDWLASRTVTSATPGKSATSE